VSRAPARDRVGRQLAERLLPRFPSFGIVSEMREPRLFNRSMLTAHFIVTATYTVRLRAGRSIVDPESGR
jgi:hypothetical protein